jgi:hypothetical protein
MEKDIRNNRRNFIESLDCAKEAWATLEEKTITQADINEAESDTLDENDDHKEFIGENIDKTMICHIPFFIQKMLRDSEDPGQIDTKPLKQPSSSIDNVAKISVNFYAAERELYSCSVKKYYNLNLDFSDDNLSNLFYKYSAHLKYSECPDRSSLEALQKMVGVEVIDLFMSSYEDAVEAAGKIMDAEDAAHSEL